MSRAAKRLAAVVLGAVAGLAIAEVAMRVALVSTGVLGPRRHAWTELELFRPSLHSCFAIHPDGPQLEFRGPHNRLGFRGPEVAVPKPVGVFRIACLGGSTTYGTRNETDAETWPRRLEALLRADAPAVEVVNAGLPAGNSAETLQAFREKVLPLEPDLVVLHEGVNDIWPRFAPHFRSDYGRFRKTWAYEEPRRVRVAAWSALAFFLYDRFGPPEPVTALRAYTTVPYDARVESEIARFEASSAATFERNERSIVDACLGAGVAVVVATQAFDDSLVDRDLGERAGMMRRGLNEHADASRRVAAARGAPLCDLQAAMDVTGAFADFSHHNAIGADRAARLVAETIRRADLLTRR